LDHHVRGCGVLALDREAVYIEELQTGCDVVKWIWRVANLIAECKSPYGASFVWLHELHHCMACVEEKKGSEFLVSSNAESLKQYLISLCAPILWWSRQGSGFSVHNSHDFF
jgi:hypothetical protein